MRKNIIPFENYQETPDNVNRIVDIGRNQNGGNDISHSPRHYGAKNSKVRYLYFAILVSFTFFSNSAFSANRYWVGGASNWNNTAHWSNTSGGASGFSVPGFNDTAVFDGGNAVNCTIDINASVSNFKISAMYSGTISLNSGITLTVAAAGFNQAGGTFTGNNGNISINGSFNLTGGTFTSTTGTLQISSGYTYSAGTFNHNNGTVSFSTTQTITGNSSFYNILFVAGGGQYTIAAGTIITSTNNVTINGGASCTINTGIVEIKGDLTLISSSYNTVNGGSATFLFNGTGTQNINSAITTIILGTNEKVNSLPNIEINKTSGSLNLIGIINLNGTSWNTIAGTGLINPGTSTLNINSNVTFTGQNLSLYNIHINANGQTITLSPSNYKLTSTNNVIINGGSYYTVNSGILEILGDLTLINTLASAVNGGSGTFRFAGSGIQNINSSASGINHVCALPSVEINKTSGTLNITGILNFNGTSWNTVAGASLVNAGTSVINLLTNTTLSGQNMSFYDIYISGNFNTTTISAGVTWTSTHLLTLGGTTSWYQINTGTLNAKGDVLVTNINTSNNVGGSAVLLFDGTANQTLTGSGVAGGGRLPQVQINKTGGILALAGNVISTDHNWTYTAGNVDASTNASTIDFYKASSIDGQGTSTTMAFHHVIFSGFIALGGNMDVNGDFTIRSGVNNRLDVNSSGNYQLNVAGNWTNNNSVTAISFNQQSGKVVFDGGSAQAITLALATHTEIFYNLEIGNTGTGLTLNAPISISNNLNFITGKIYSSTSTILGFNNAATATGANNSSFVSGPVDKTGNQLFTFPTGKNTSYAPIGMSAPSLTTDKFTGEYFDTDPNTLYNVNSKDVSIHHTSRCEYWKLDRTTGTSNVSVSLSWDARSCGINVLSDLKIVRWDGAQWKDHGNGGTTGSAASGSLVTFASVSSFSPFTLGSGTVANPLPVELIYFSGKCKNKNIVLKWGTASEMNNDYFTVERTTDYVHWQDIGKVKGAGNSFLVRNYSFSDTNPNNSISYYRLKQTDFNGKTEHFNFISVDKCSQEINKIIIVPNPSTGIFYIKNGSKINPTGSIEIYNAIGQKVYFSGTYQSPIDLSNMPDGIYFVHFNADTKISVQKIVVEK